MKRKSLFYILPILLLVISAGLAGIVFSEGEKVAQIGGTYYSSLQAAVNAATGGTAGSPVAITLLRDTNEDIVISNPYLTIDLNKKTLTGKGDTLQKPVTVSSSTARAAVTVGPNISGVTLRNGTVVMDRASTGDESIVGVLVQGGVNLEGEAGSLTLDRLTIHVTNTGNNATFGIMACDGSMKAETVGQSNVVSAYPSGSLEVKNSEISATGRDSHGIYTGCWSSNGAQYIGNITVDTCTIKAGMGLNTTAGSCTVKGRNEISGIRARVINEENHSLDLYDALGNLGSINTKSQFTGLLLIKGDIDTLFENKLDSNINIGTYFSVLPETFPQISGRLTYTSDQAVIDKGYPYVTAIMKDLTMTGSGNAGWFLSLDGTLSISNSGTSAVEISAFSEENPIPWAAVSDKITQVVMTGKFADIKSGTFSGLTNLQAVHIQSVDGTIQADAFSGCSALTDVYMEFEEGKIQGAFPAGVSPALHYDTKQAASLALAAIKAIGTVSYTKEDFNRVDQARKKYDAAIAAGVTAEWFAGYTVAGTDAYTALTEAEEAYAALEENDTAYEVVLYTRLLDQEQYAVANVSGGGFYYTYRGGDVTAYYDSSVNDGISFLGWYLTSEEGELIRRVSTAVVNNGMNVLHINPTENMILTAVYSLLTGNRGGVGIPATAEYTVTEPILYTWFDPNEGRTYDATEIQAVEDVSNFTKTCVYNFGTQVTISSNTGDFRYWADGNGNILSYDREYTFTLIHSLQISEVTSSAAKVPVVFCGSDGETILFMISCSPEDTEINLDEYNYEWSDFDMTEAAVLEAVKNSSAVKVKLAAAE